LPLYEYECTKCHKKTEKIESVSGPHLKKCPHCGGKVERLVTAPAIQFKGAGWYVTDYAGKNASRTECAGAEKGAEKSTEKSSEKESAKEQAAPAKAAKDTSEKKTSKK
jgi:putative FmdB family regulatory protein